MIAPGRLEWDDVSDQLGDIVRQALGETIQHFFDDAFCSPRWLSRPGFSDPSNLIGNGICVGGDDRLTIGKAFHR